MAYSQTENSAKEAVKSPVVARKKKKIPPPVKEKPKVNIMPFNPNIQSTPVISGFRAHSPDFRNDNDNLMAEYDAKYGQYGSLGRRETMQKRRQKFENARNSRQCGFPDGGKLLRANSMGSGLPERPPQESPYYVNANFEKFSVPVFEPVANPGFEPINSGNPGLGVRNQGYNPGLQPVTSLDQILRHPFPNPNLSNQDTFQSPNISYPESFQQNPNFSYPDQFQNPPVFTPNKNYYYMRPGLPNVPNVHPVMNGNLTSNIKTPENPETLERRKLESNLQKLISEGKTGRIIEQLTREMTQGQIEKLLQVTEGLSINHHSRSKSNSEQVRPKSVHFNPEKPASRLIRSHSQSSQNNPNQPNMMKYGSLPRSVSYSNTFRERNPPHPEYSDSSSSDSSDEFDYQLPQRKAYGGVRLSYVPNDRRALNGNRRQRRRHHTADSFPDPEQYKPSLLPPVNNNPNPVQNKNNSSKNCIVS